MTEHSSSAIGELESRRDELKAAIAKERKSREAPVRELENVEAELRAARAAEIPELDAEDKKLACEAWEKCRELQTKVLTRLRGLDDDFAELNATRDNWIAAKLRVAQRHGTLSPNARLYMRNEISPGAVGGRLPEGVSKASLEQLRLLLRVVVASLYAFPDVRLKVTRNKAKSDPRFHRRYETLPDGTVRVLRPNENLSGV